MARFPPPEVAAALSDAALKHRVPQSLLWAVAFAESSFDPGRVGPVTASGERARGLMQLMPATIKRFGVADPMSARDSADGGAAVLATLATALKWDVPAMLAAYNWGPASYARAVNEGKPVPASVKRFVARVQAARHYYRLQRERAPGSLIQSLNEAIEALATANPHHVPATQLAREWRSEFFSKRKDDSDALAVANPILRTYWRAYRTVFERAPLDMAATDPSLLEPDFWLRAAKQADEVSKAARELYERAKDIGGQALIGTGAALFLLALFVFAANGGKRR